MELSSRRTTADIEIEIEIEISNMLATVECVSWNLMWLQLYDKMEEINGADQTGVKKAHGQCSQAVREVQIFTHVVNII